MLRWLSARPRTEREIARRLAGWGVETEAAERVLARLRSAGLADDGAFASAYADELARKGLSGVPLRARLEARGIGRETAARAAAGAAPVDPLSLARRRVPAVPADPAAAVRRVAGWLVRRGVPGPVALRAARTAVAESTGCAEGPTFDDGSYGA